MRLVIILFLALINSSCFLLTNLDFHYEIFETTLEVTLTNNTDYNAEIQASYYGFNKNEDLTQEAKDIECYTIKKNPFTVPANSTYTYTQNLKWIDEVYENSINTYGSTVMDFYVRKSGPGIWEYKFMRSVTIYETTTTLNEEIKF
ncbi:MAG TPA: hypothetical protein PK385_04930 [Spirochaetota bacterium]|jgi:hypothetical protein|nr:MAG: hypothetical protein BWX91_00215 [Spirochaetes bacterium ADurb.Bin133]HNZ25636.1 hypothetical protein [Spirochaetota bacterium]HOF01439.1 hypothetical protein [Spirochaetota bacterium]HOS32999.1 hypothetical protein [Spirochaetota bacterium]HOS55384.1 hypothetical protein [Spirochaetota bacterium]